MWGIMDSTKIFRERNKNGGYGPDIYSAGVIIDGKPKIWERSVEVSNAEEARAEALKQIGQGVDFIKVYSNLNPEAFDAIAETARENGVPFAGHVPNKISMFHAVRQGMASIEHMFGLLPASSPLGDSLMKDQRNKEHIYVDSFDEERFDSLCALLVMENSWLCPTIAVNKVFTGLDDHTEFKKSDRLNYMDPFTKRIWSSYLSDSAEVAEEAKAFNFLLPLVGKAHAKGVGILAGTDFPNPYTYPGFSMHDELQLLVEAGLSELAALQAATISPAKFIKNTDDFGTVAEGKVASLILLAKNPLEDISNTQTIQTVLQRGQLFDRQALDGMLVSIKEELAAAKTPYSEVFKKIMKEDGFQQALDSLTILLENVDESYLLDENDLGFVMQDFYDAGDKDKMEEFARYLMKWFPESSQVHTWSGEVMMMVEKKEEAIELFKKALELDPENERAVKNLENSK
jgi:hypothetical protein